jgi:uncharacterized membrane protein
MPRERPAETAKKPPTGENRHDGQSSNKQTQPPVIRNVQAIADLEKKMLEERAHIGRLSELTTKIAGSGKFIVGHLVVFGVWIALNATRFAFDPKPWDLLNLALTFEAIVLTSIVLIAQRDLKRVTDLRANLDLQVNILAEQELTAILGLLNRVCAKLGIDPKRADPDVEQLAQDTDVKTIATVIEKSLDS